MAEIEGIQMVESPDELSGPEKEWYQSVYDSVRLTERDDAKRHAQAIDSFNMMRVWRAKGSGPLTRLLRTGQFPLKYSRL